METIERNGFGVEGGDSQDPPPTTGRHAGSDQFSAIVAHDLESSLLAVSKNAQLLREVGPHLTEEQENHLARIERTALRMKGLLNGVRSLARGSVELEQVSLEAVIDEVRETLAPVIAERDAAVVSESRLPTVTADHNQILQLFQNLILNAIKFGPERGGRVTVSCERWLGAWRIAVADQGPGIEPQEQEGVFEPFRRLRTGNHHPGTGLGLAICRRVADNHGGSLTIQSSPGAGATFIFTLPDLSR